MAQVTAKSQLTRKVKCRKCFVDMEQQLVLPATLGEDVGWSWLCPKCGLRHEVKRDVDTLSQ